MRKVTILISILSLLPVVSYGKAFKAKQEVMVIEGIVINIHKEKLSIFNTENKTEETYILTRDTKLEDIVVFQSSKDTKSIKLQNLISSVEDFSKFLRKGYRVVLKVSPKTKYILQIAVKEIPI